MLRIGQQPPRDELFGNNLTDECSGWSGVSRSNDDIELLLQMITKTVEDVGGKVRVFKNLVLYFTRPDHHIGRCRYYLKLNWGIPERLCYYAYRPLMCLSLRRFVAPWLAMWTVGNRQLWVF